MADPPPLVVTTSLLHRDLHMVPVRLAFYRTPRSEKRTPSSTSSIGVTPTPLIHPLNNPLCPIVCQTTVLSNTEYQSSKNTDTAFGPGLGPGHARSQVRGGLDTEDKIEEHDPLTQSSLFEELETIRGSSWQYELQQLKFANQRLHEELHALEGAHAKSGTGVGAGSSSSTTGHMATVPFSQSCSSASTTIPIPRQPQLSQTQIHYTPMMHSDLATSLPSLPPPNSLHEQDPPSSGWSSLAGANGHGPNPRKRSWRSENGPTT